MFPRVVRSAGAVLAIAVLINVTMHPDGLISLPVFHDAIATLIIEPASSDTINIERARLSEPDQLPESRVAVGLMPPST